MPEYDAVMDSPVGRLGIHVERDCLTAIDFLDRRSALRPARTAVAARVVAQLQAYFQQPRQGFSLPLSLRGTPFQQRVWAQLRAIPSGEVRSYGEIAALLSSSARAVGGACRANPVPVVIPCHRVVAKAGVGGFSGATTGRYLRIKQWLLTHEGGYCGSGGQKTPARHRCRA